MLSLVCLAAFAFADEGLALDPVHDALKKIGEAGAATDWPAESAARQELIALGKPVVRTLHRELGEMEDVRVRRACYEILGESFAKDGQAVLILAGGLADEDDQIRYGVAFRLGDLKVYSAHRRLRLVMDDVKVPEHIRLAAAKSLAQLGEACALRLLYEGATADGYMDRYIANIGLKALSGKDLSDFEGYQFSEGNSVSGGRELMVAFDALTFTEKKARRFSAAAAYFRRLKAERPDLYKHLTMPL